LKDGNDGSNWTVSNTAANALRKIGDSDTLPRKILADSRFSAQERIEVLDRLRRVRYKDRYTTFRYTLPDTRTLCQAVLNEEDAEARTGAQIVLGWLNGDQHLLRASQRDATTEPQELLRTSQSAMPETQPETLLRAADEPEGDTEPPFPPPTLLQRLFRKHANVAS
jgi:hypothetical protein